MRYDAEEREEEGQSVDEAEKDVDGYDGIDEAGEQATSEHSVFFNEFRKVVEARGWLARTLASKLSFLEWSLDCDFKSRTRMAE